MGTHTVSATIGINPATVGINPAFRQSLKEFGLQKEVIDKLLGFCIDGN